MKFAAKDQASPSAQIDERRAIDAVVSPDRNPAPSLLAPEDPDRNTHNDDLAEDLDPLARTLYLELRYRPENDRRLVFRALTARLNGAASNPERVETALHALAVCMDDIGRPPSRRAYDAWRDSQQRPGCSSDWPSSSGIRKAFSASWARALDALGVEPTPDVKARRLLKLRRNYTRQELIDAVAACVAATTPERMTWMSYQRWSKEEVLKPDDERSCLRPALSAKTFVNEFGSWGEAVAAAGYAELTRLSERHRIGPSGGNHNYTDRCMTDALGQANRACKPSPKSKADVAGGWSLSMTVYASWRRQRIDAAIADGDVIYIPGMEAISNRFGSWPRALHAAGLISKLELQMARQRGPRAQTDDELLAHLVSALLELRPGWPEHPDPAAPPLTRSEYRRWRFARLKAGATGWERPVSDSQLCLRLGSWAEVLELAAAKYRSDAKRGSAISADTTADPHDPQDQRADAAEGEAGHD